MRPLVILLVTHTLIAGTVGWTFPGPASADVSSVDLSGEIDEEFYLQVVQAIGTDAKEIRIKSSGGDNVWALQAANALNNQQDTQLVIAGKCVSACASLMFATDNVRVTKDAFIAVHRTSIGMEYVLGAGAFDLSEKRFEALNFYADEERRLLEQAGRNGSFFEQAMRELRPVCYQRMVTTKSGLFVGYQSRAEADYWMPGKDIFVHYRGIGVSGNWPDSRDLLSNKDALQFIEKYKIIRSASLEDVTEAPIETFGECQN